MAELSSYHFTDTFRKAAWFLAWSTMIIASLIMLEWFFFRVNDSILMAPISAALFILSCYAFLLKFNDKKSVEVKIRWSNRISVFILLICVLKIYLIYSGIDAHINHFWKKNLDVPTVRLPTVMAANSIIGFILLSISILLLDNKSPKKTTISQYICVFVFFLSLFASYGHIIKARYLYTLFLDVVISQSTLLCFFLLALAILMSRPQTGFMRILVGEHLKQNFILRLFGTVTPLLLGFIKFKAEDYDVVSKTTGIVIFTFINYAISWTIIAFNIEYQKKIRRINKRTFDKLKWNELRLSTIAENISEGVVIVKKNHETTYFNSVVKKLIKNFKKNLPIEKWPKTYGFYPLQKKETPIDYSDLTILNALKGKNIDNKEVKLINVPGSEPSTLLLTGRSVHNKKGEVVEGILIIRDITERRNIEKEYYKTSIKLRTILGEIKEALVIIDEEGNHIYSNPSAEKLLGKFPSSTLNIKNWTNYFGLYYPDKFTFFPIEELAVQRALKGEKCERTRLYVKNKHLEQGHYIYLSCTPVIDKEKKVHGVLISVEKGNNH